ncbi:DNA gyrase subunit A [Candidatus Riesia sp. GBBU]|nr:DNA gyrase subunit A [Candidatus Riesia sp. GBBU]
MKNVRKKYYSIDIEKELKNSYLDYAMSVIIGRALPDIRDGLKPVHRRILYAMNILGNFWNKPYKKSARIVGDVIGKYHPHGDNAVYETIVRLAQKFSMRYALIDGQGNFGSIDGDSAAAMRYTEIRMTKIAHELLKDLEKETVNFVSNYDGNEKIPEIMPTRIPNLLINGSSGIAVGMTTNIPPHNIREIIDGCIAYIDNKNISTEELLQHIPGPDFPTYAIISGTKGIEKAYKTGNGKICIRARVDIKKNKKNGRDKLIVKEIPYQVNKLKLIEKIIELVKNKRIQGIHSLRDESDRNGMRIVIEIKKDSMSEIVLNNLYSLTQLQISFCINMVALCNGKPRTLSLKDIIKYFVDHRKEIIARRTNFKLKKTKERVHSLEAIIVALENIKEIVKIIQISSDTNSAKLNLLNNKWKSKNIDLFSKKVKNSEELTDKHQLNRYRFTENQVKVILDLKLHKLSNLEQKKLTEEYHQLSKKILILFSVLKDQKKLMKIIKEELMSIKDKYQDSRRTEIQKKYSKINIEDLIHKKDVIITISYNGYIKYQPLSNFEIQKRGGKGKISAKIKDEDFIRCLLITNTHKIILFFSNLGRLYWTKVYKLPEHSRESRGKPIVNFFDLRENEKITNIFSIQNFNDNLYILIATKNGLIKKTKLRNFSHYRKNGIISIKLKYGDTIASVGLTSGENEVMLFSSFGRAVRFSEHELRPIGRMTSGVNGMKLKNGEKIVSLIVLNKEKDILTVTKNGFCNKTNKNQYKKKSRFISGVKVIKTNKRNGNVVCAIQISKFDRLFVITNLGTLLKTKASGINSVSRNTKGVTLIKIKEKERVVHLQNYLK